MPADGATGDHVHTQAGRILPHDASRRIDVPVTIKGREAACVSSSKIRDKQPEEDPS